MKGKCGFSLWTANADGRVSHTMEYQSGYFEQRPLSKDAIGTAIEVYILPEGLNPTQAVVKRLIKPVATVQVSDLVDGVFRVVLASKREKRFANREDMIISCTLPENYFLPSFSEFVLLKRSTGQHISRMTIEVQKSGEFSFQIPLQGGCNDAVIACVVAKKFYLGQTEAFNFGAE